MLIAGASEPFLALDALLCCFLLLELVQPEPYRIFSNWNFANSCPSGRHITSRQYAKPPLAILEPSLPRLSCASSSMSFLLFVAVSARYTLLVYICKHRNAVRPYLSCIFIVPARMHVQLPSGDTKHM